MGWTRLDNAPDKNQVIEECINSPPGKTCLKHALYGNELWTVWQEDTGNKYIILFLLEKYKGSWGYKDMSESQHPFYYKCPVAYLDECPVENQQWRNVVITLHKERQNNRANLAKIKVGMYVTLRDSNPNVFRVSNIKPLQGYSIGDNGKVGSLYKLVKARIVSVSETSPLIRWLTK
jgi:hypothetical protein